MAVGAEGQKLIFIYDRLLAVVAASSLGLLYGSESHLVGTKTETGKDGEGNAVSVCIVCRFVRACRVVNSFF